MYIINFLTKKDVSFYLTMFHTASILGLGFGFLINVGLLHIELDNQFFNKYTIGSIISIAFSFVLLIISIILFTEAHSSKFSITSMQMFGEGIMGDDDNINETDFAVRKQTMALKDIDTQLGSFNRENRFDDTNLVSKSVSELAMREEGQLHYLLKDFIVYLLIIFTTKFVNESIIINSFIIYVDESGKTNDTTYLWIISLILGGSSLLILLVELSLSRKYKFITERALIIILLVILLIINILLIIFVTKSIAIYILVGLDNIFTSITEKYVAHLFLYIMPENYIICKINGNVFINIFSMISRIICCILILLSDLQSMYKYIICIPMISLCFISTLLYICNIFQRNSS